MKVGDRRRFLAGCAKYFVSFTGQHASLASDAAGKSRIQPAFAADHAPIRRDRLLPCPAFFFGSLGDDSHKNAGTQRTRNIHAAALCQRAKDKTDDARNFKIKVWIDENDRQIVKVDGKAVRSGPLSHADYAAFSSSQGLSEKEIEQSKKQLADSTLYYDEGTTIVQEWTR
ncbi:MAG TPA: hypothetical protein VH024_05070 [Candidatus Angelobacter sp.]|nr:hypothetical protein [Candidatus Angelobacter sp.]